MKQDLLSPHLFGNEAGEDEDIQVLSSYFVEKPSFKQFYESSSRFLVVRSRKGIGKSALLRKTLASAELQDGTVALYVKGSDLMALQSIGSSTPHDLVYGWQQRICSRIAVELGRKLKLALGDDAISLVESAELAGFKGRNLIGTLTDRLRLRIKGSELAIEKLVPPSHQPLLTRYLEGKDVTVWLLVDDIDATFLNREDQRLLISSFFSACRNLVREVEGLVIRASVRTDVWAVLAQYDESLDKCEQYMTDLCWSRRETGLILRKKIASYFRRQYPGIEAYRYLDPESKDDSILSLVFVTRFRWGRDNVPADRPIHILSAGRPRWAAQLCKLAGKHAVAINRTHIGDGDVSEVMSKYGKSRLDDLYKEHLQQCPSIMNILESFAGGPRRYATADLLVRITKRIVCRYGLPRIDGLPNGADSIYIAHFLYRIGFIYARENVEGPPLSFIRHEDRPHLLASTANLDDGLTWEVHPSYRAVLRIR